MLSKDFFVSRKETDGQYGPDIGQVADKDMMRIIDLKAGSCGALDRVSRGIHPCTPTAPECSTGTGPPRGRDKLQGFLCLNSAYASE
jgi:hypothetical protein